MLYKFNSISLKCRLDEEYGKPGFLAQTAGGLCPAVAEITNSMNTYFKNLN